MEPHTNAPTFKGEYLPSPRSASLSPDRLSEQALMALPFIGMFVGVDELVPTRSIYAVYDSSNCGITYVRGDGSFAVTRQICFTKQFKDPSIPLHRSQRTYLPELMARSAMHYHLTNSRDRYPANILAKFPTLSSVKASLTYLGDQVLDSCPALTPFDSTTEGPDQAPPHMVLEDKPVWDFHAGGFQAYAAPGHDIILTKYEEFQKKYPNVSITVADFQHAAFCLAGMLKAGFIDFLYEGQNDRRYFVRGLTPPKPAKLVDPLRTHKGWTVDCFLARFAKFHWDFIDDDIYVHIPNPINWLEAEMDNEARLESVKRPWKIDIDNEDNPVISFELLKIMQFKIPGGSREYPKSLIPKASRPLRVNDLISKKGKFRESKYAKKDREKRENEAKETGRGNYASIDLTEEDGFAHGHMGGHMGPDPDSIRRTHQVSHAPRSRRGGPQFQASTPAAGQKRKHSNGNGSSHNSAVIIDDDEMGHVNIKDAKPKFENYDNESDDLYNDSGSEKHRKKKTQRNNHSQQRKSPVPVAYSLFASPGRTLREQEELAIRLSTANSQADTPSSFRNITPASRNLEKTRVGGSERDSEYETQVALKKTRVRDSERNSDSGYRRSKGSESRRLGSHNGNVKKRKTAIPDNHEGQDGIRRLSAFDKRLFLGPPFSGSSPEQKSKSPSKFDSSDDEESDDENAAQPKLNNNDHQAAHGSESSSSRETRTNIADSDNVDQDDVSNTPSSSSTLNNASDAENIPRKQSRNSTASPKSDGKSSQHSSYDPPQKSSSTTKADSNPHTPSSQTGARFYRHIAGQGSVDASPILSTPARRPRKSTASLDHFFNFAPSKTISPDDAVKDEDLEFP
ncbi:hypothetical protein IFR05_012701 [Cadophora sp. M221]|nr:hypothetical protein IFR05_012701 [Cadophora sp. M221]